MDPSSARQQAIDQAIREALIAREAAKRGISISDASVDAFIADQRRQNQAAPAENRAMFQATLDGLGMTEQQYWSDPRMRAAVRSILVSSRLIDQLTPAGGLPVAM